MKSIKIASAIIIGILGIWAGIYIFWYVQGNLLASLFLYISGLILFGVGCHQWENYIKEKRYEK